jgi:hypothetical protein
LFGIVLGRGRQDVVAGVETDRSGSTIGVIAIEKVGSRVFGAVGQKVVGSAHDKLHLANVKVGLGFKRNRQRSAIAVAAKGTTGRKVCGQDNIVASIPQVKGLDKAILGSLDASKFAGGQCNRRATGIRQRGGCCLCQQGVQSRRDTRHFLIARSQLAVNSSSTSTSSSIHGRLWSTHNLIFQQAPTLNDASRARLDAIRPTSGTRSTQKAPVVISIGFGKTTTTTAFGRGMNGRLYQGPLSSVAKLGGVSDTIVEFVKSRKGAAKDGRRQESQKEKGALPCLLEGHGAKRRLE